MWQENKKTLQLQNQQTNFIGLLNIILLCVHKPFAPVLSLNNEEMLNSIYMLSEIL